MKSKEKNDKNKVDLVLETINHLDSIEKDIVYRTLWQAYIEQDIKELAKERDVKLSKDDVSFMASRFVWEGDYDCNLSYWDNLSNLMNEQ